jgi:hypothetical protein
MAKRRRTKKNTWLWYGLYAAVGYYAYNWWAKRQVTQTTMVVVPPGTQT